MNKVVGENFQVPEHPFASNGLFTTTVSPPLPFSFTQVFCHRPIPLVFLAKLYIEQKKKLSLPAGLLRLLHILLVHAWRQRKLGRGIAIFKNARTKTCSTAPLPVLFLLVLRF